MIRYLRKLFTPEPVSPAGETVRSNRQRTSLDLFGSEEYFADLVEGVRDYAVFLLDRHGNIQTWNAGAERIKGYREHEIIGEHFSRFYPSDSISSGWPEHELTVASETGRFEDEGWRLRKDGSRFWASVVITALRTPSGDVRGYLKITRDLTDRKQAEEKLRLSEERFRLLVDSVHDYAIFMLDPRGNVTTWNTGAERLKGYTAKEIIGKHISTFYPPEAVERDWPGEELRIAARDGRIEDEGWRVRKDGSQFWANVVIAALRDESGRLVGFSKVTRDLSDRRQAEENARLLLQDEAARKAAEESAAEIDRQREELQVTLASIGDAVVVTDEQGRVTFLNSVAAGLTGWTQDEAAGKLLEQVFRIVNEKTLQEVENPVKRVFRERQVVELANHTAVVNRQGEMVPIEDTAAPIFRKDGSIAGAVLVFRDVTEPRRAREARLFLASIVESSDDAIIGETLDGHIASWNRGAERLYGYTADEVLGKPLSILAPNARDDDLAELLTRVREGEFIEHYETQRLRRDGSLVDVSLTISPIRDASGDLIGASKIARDITPRKEAERRQNEFLALLAHELRNPLAPIRSGLEVLRLAGENRKVAEEARSLMERQLQQLVRLVDDLLDMSRISRGKLQLTLQPLDLVASVRHAVEDCRPFLEERGHRLSVSLPEEPIPVQADSTRLAQVVNNLMNNAAKYTDPGGHVWLSLKREGNEAVLSIRDNGIGIPPQMLTQVFDMFTQVDCSLEKSHGGLGVGLAIVKRMIEMHDGSVAAFSEGPGKGSEFVIRLPVDAQDALTTATTTQEEAPDVKHSLRILVVDDNRDAANSLSQMLKLKGHAVELAHDGEEGVNRARQSRPDVILLDIGMPRLNGYEAARRIREQPWGQDITLVALTGWGQQEDRRRSESARFNFHLVKPVEPAALQDILSRITNGD